MLQHVLSGVVRGDGLPRPSRRRLGDATAERRVARRRVGKRDVFRLFGAIDTVGDEFEWLSHLSETSRPFLRRFTIDKQTRGFEREELEHNLRSKRVEHVGE